jgi:hypothetical protein
MGYTVAAPSFLLIVALFGLMGSSFTGPLGNLYVLAGSDCLSIPEIACTAAGFETLCELVTIAGLAELLSDEGPYTVFAPLNTSFDLLDSEVVDALLNDTGRHTI